MITRVRGVTVGHWTDVEGGTGCTVVLFPERTTASCAVVGAAPDSRQTELLRPENTVREIHAVLLTGGSAFGLGAADGVMGWLEERGRGFAIGDAVVPIVPTAVLFDLGVGKRGARPGPAAGRAACEVASSEVEEGSVGAGTGATVGKWAGTEHASKGGVGGACVVEGDVVVGALAVCNAVGDVVDEQGEVLAGARVPPGTPWSSLAPTNTVLAVVATNAALDKPACAHMARMAAAGIARAVRPAHTFFDGDIVFCASTQEVDCPPALPAARAADVVAEALRRGVRAARGLHGVPGAGDG